MSEIPNYGNPMRPVGESFMTREAAKTVQGGSKYVEGLGYCTSQQDNITASASGYRCCDCGEIFRDQTTIALHICPAGKSIKASKDAIKALAEPVVFLEVTGDRSANYEFLNLPTDQAANIVRLVLPEVLNLFLSKNRDYGDGMDAFKLGARGQFVDIWRKVGKLHSALWEGKELVGEQVPEIMMDLIGHLLLALLDYQELD